jgi:hypothetical protein
MHCTRATRRWCDLARAGKCLSLMRGRSGSTQLSVVCVRSTKYGVRGTRKWSATDNGPLTTDHGPRTTDNKPLSSLHPIQNLPPPARQEIRIGKFGKNAKPAGRLPIDSVSENKSGKTVAPAVESVDPNQRRLCETKRGHRSVLKAVSFVRRIPTPDGDVSHDLLHALPPKNSTRSISL